MRFGNSVKKKGRNYQAEESAEQVWLPEIRRHGVDSYDVVNIYLILIAMHF